MTTDDPNTSLIDERVYYTVADMKNGTADINAAVPFENWTAESRFYLQEEDDTYFLTIAVEYAAIPSQWCLQKEDWGTKKQYFLNKLSLYYYHYRNGILLAAEDEEYTAHIFFANLTDKFILLEDPEIIAGSFSFFGFSASGEDYKNRYDFSKTKVADLTVSDPDFIDYKWTNKDICTLAYIHYGQGSKSISPIYFSFGNYSDNVGYYMPSISGCPCPANTVTYGPPVIPPDNPIIINDPSSSSRSSSRSSSSKSSSRSSQSSSRSSSRSSSQSSSQSEVPSNPSEVPSNPSEVPSTPSDNPSNPSESSGTPNLVYILYSHEYACMFDEQSSSFVLQWTTSTSVYGTYIDPADAPYSDGEIVHTGDGWALLFTIDGPVDYETAIPHEPPLVLGSCIPDSPDCSEMSFDFPVGIIDSHSNEFSAPANYMIVTEYTPPVVVDDNGNPATFEAFLIDTVDWSEEIRFSAGSQHKLGYRSYSLEIRSIGIVKTPGKIVFRFCPV